MTPDGMTLEQKDEVLLKDLLKAMWQYKFIGLIFVVLATTAVGVASLFVTKSYTSIVTVIAITENPSSQAGVLGSLSNNLANLAGVSANSDPKKVESIAVLQSKMLSSRFIRENNLLPILYSKIWNPTTHAWKTTDPRKIPTVWKANEFFRREVCSVTIDNKNGLVTLSVRWKDPVLAATWANGLIRLANDVEKDTAIAESEKNIAYLSEQAAKTDVLGIKEVIYSLLESEFSKAMLAKGNREYSFKTVDPAVPAENPSYPDKLVWVLTGFFTSLSLAIFGAFCIVAWRKA